MVVSKRVIVVHGWEGTPEEGWFPWLKKELQKKDFKVKVPTMPDTARPKMEKWIPHLKKQVGKPDKNTYLVGHSMGCQTILRYLEDLPKGSNIGGIVLVAGFLKLKNLTNEEYETVKPWLTKDINLDKVKTHTHNITTIFSDNDTWVSLSNAKVFEKKLGAKVIIMKKKGHISGDDRIKKMPLVFREILRFSNK